MRPWVVSSLALAALARATAIYVSHDKESLINSTRRDQPSPRSSYNLVEHHSGNTFFDGFDFFTGADPTGGYTAYQSQSSAVQKGLAYVQSDGKAVIRVDSWTTLNSGQNRDSVRIESQSSYDTGLMIFDVANMPWGCSVRFFPFTLIITLNGAHRYGRHYGRMGQWSRFTNYEIL